MNVLVIYIFIPEIHLMPCVEALKKQKKQRNKKRYYKQLYSVKLYFNKEFM